MNDLGVGFANSSLPHMLAHKLFPSCLMVFVAVSFTVNKVHHNAVVLVVIFS